MNQTAINKNAKLNGKTIVHRLLSAGKISVFSLFIFHFSLFTLTVSAHEGKPHHYSDLLYTWSFDPLIVISLAACLGLYFAGVFRLWRAAGRGRGIGTKEFLFFAGGWLSMFVALVSPLHPWGEVLFSAHMTQHEILMLISAPLFVLSRPLAATVWAFPLDWRRKIGNGINKNYIQRAWQFLTKPLVAFAVHAFALWIWHVPALFQATLKSDAVHTFQHLSFFLSAMLFWWSLLHRSGGASGYGAGVLYLFTTSIHTGLLGALLTFSTNTFYPDYAKTTASWNLTPLEDQQLGGLIMWIPAGLVYIFAALLMFAGWMTESEKRVQFREKQAYKAAQISAEITKQTFNTVNSIKLLIVIAAFSLFAVFQACDSGNETEHAASEMTGGDVAHGRAIIREQGCASCHTIPGIKGAQANVGPSLEKIGGRTYIAGVLENNPENMVRWLENPPAVDEKTAMPNLNLSEEDARDVAAYLYTLK